MKKKKGYTLPLLFLPGFTGVILLWVLPFLLTMQYSLAERAGIWGKYTLDHYASAFHNPMFQLGVKNYLLFALVAVPVSGIFSLALALLLKRWGKASRVLLLSLLLPFVVPSGSSAFFWNTVFSLNGFINRILFQIGFEPVFWDAGSWSILIPVVIYIWKFGGLFTFIFLVGLSQIPNEYYELARVEGAGRWSSFGRITLVYLSPAFILFLLFAFTATFKIFRELFMLFGRYPNSNLYLIGHFINNQLGNMNLAVLCSASVMIALCIFIFFVPLCFAEKRLSDVFEQRGELNSFFPRSSQKPWVFVFCVILSLIFLLPVLFTVSNSLMSAAEVIGRYSPRITEQNAGELSRGGLHFVSPGILPGFVTVEQYADFLKRPEYLRMFWNSVLLTFPAVICNVAVSAAGAFVFLRVRTKAMSFLLLVYIFLMLIPPQVMITPQYVFFQSLGLADSYWPLILPAAFNPMGVCLVCFQLKGFPKECIEAAQVSGAGEFCIFRKIVWPNIKSSLVLLIILSFTETWNMVDQAVVFVVERRRFPLSVFLSHMIQSDMGIVSAGSVIYMLPACLIFFTCLTAWKQYMQE